MNIVKFVAANNLQASPAVEDVNKGLAAVSSQVATMSGMPLLRLSQANGGWVYGPDEGEPDSNNVVAIQSTLQRGFVCWYNSAKEGEFMESMFTAAPTSRSSMAELPAGREWVPQLSVDFLLDDGTQVRYSSSSAGGKEAVAKLAGEFLKKRSEYRDAELYNVQLKSESYINKRYGNKTIYKPVFKVTGCMNLKGEPLGAPALSLM